MNPNHIPTNANFEQGERPAVDLGKDARRLLDSEDVKKLPELDQGEFIVEQLLGRIVAAGDIESRAGVKTPVDIVKDLEEFASNVSTEGNRALEFLTRTGGIRSMAFALARDVRIGPYWTDMVRRLNVSKDGRVTLNSRAMLSGYLDAKEKSSPATNFRSWNSKVLDEIDQFSKADSRGRWDSSDLLSSDIDVIRRGQLDWGQVMGDARAAGVDPDLLRRSAEHLRERYKVSKELGYQALNTSLNYASSDVLNPYDDYLQG